MTDIIYFFVKAVESPLSAIAFFAVSIGVPAAVFIIGYKIADRAEKRNAKKLPPYLKAYDRHNNRIK